jgi:hypothetical protein
MVAKTICQKLRSAVSRYKTNAYFHRLLLLGLLEFQPGPTLDGLCGGDPEELKHGIRVLRDANIHSNVLAVVRDEDILNWSDKEPQIRYPALAKVIGGSDRAGENGQPRWTSIELSFLRRAPDPEAILSEFASRFKPEAWSGSLAEILESNSKLLDQLEPFPELGAAIAREKQRVRQMIDWERRHEEKFNRDNYESFE